ncbi:LuxR family transcriptional regulator [Streptomyces sp. NBC_01426]|uniref:helix-turn-helix transcriptional regulator n=1 Tax=Streptomyces sp. NBC_01426 TaxID=2975866 RepID=UPI002E37524A|nr:LuxR family transcriptional regulator [Streptomyces sp. NBC_01426]
MTWETEVTGRRGGVCAGPPDPAFETARQALARDGCVVVTGPWGAGKSTLARRIAAAGVADGRALVRVTGAQGDGAYPGGGLAQLLSGDVASRARGLTGARRGVLERLAHLTDRQDGAPGPAVARSAVTALLGGIEPGVLLVVDGVQWLDDFSADVLGYALRTLPAGRLTVVVTERGSGRPRVAGRLVGAHAPYVAPAPLDVTGTAALLAEHGLPARWAAPVDRLCGGHLLLTSLACTSLAALPAAERRGLATSAVLRDAAREWLETLPRPVRRTLALAALAHRPTSSLLSRAGCADAEEDLARARRAGVLRDGPAGEVVFQGALLASAAARAGGPRERTELHRALASAVLDPAHRARHHALVRDRPDRAAAEDTERAACSARAGGDRALAAELFLLAAGLTPADRPEARSRRITSAAREAAAASRTDLAWQAVEAVTEAAVEPARHVAVLLALIDSHGQALAELEPLFHRCGQLAGDDPGLLAAVELRAAIAANISQEDPERALRAAARAAELARAGGQPPLRAAALTMRARMERVLGVPDAARTLDEALALGVPAQEYGIRNSAQYLAARHAVFDDRLPPARRQLLELLAIAEREGDPEDLVDLWRSLCEVDVRLGSCARALEWADRALAHSAAHRLSPGPAWYTAALAQSVGGSFAEASRLAGRGIQASREEGDALYLARSLWVRGCVRLHTGDGAGAAATFAEVARLEGDRPVADPSMFRWRSDAVEALTAGGHTDRAGLLLAGAEATPGIRGRGPGTVAALVRARGVLLAREGRPDEAVARLGEAAAGFRCAGLPLEEARTHLARGRVERARRRQAAARTAWEEAAELYGTTGARPWREVTAALLDRLPGGRPGDGSRAGGLTPSELRLAGLICRGASNQEAAQQLFLSVKTVEGMLSRVYRKLDVRSRTQLGAALAPDR